MIINFDNIDLNADKLLSKISEKAIYEYYLGENIKEGQLYNCPFHKDTSPSMGFKLMPSTVLIHRCFACGEKGNSINFVSKLLNLSYYDTIKQINRDLASKEQPVSCIKKKESIGFTTTETRIFPIFQNYSIVDYNYWRQFHIPLSLLSEYEIKACKQVYIKSRSKELVLFAGYSAINPMYCYTLDGRYKIYRPLNPTKVGKWLNTTTSWDIQGMKQLPSKGKLLIITSSMKDVLVLRLLGYNAIAPGSEGAKLPAKLLDYLKASFEDIVIFYDNDKAGIEYASKLSGEIDSEYIYIPQIYKEKDVSDFAKSYGLEQAGCLIKELLNDRKRERIYTTQETGDSI